MKVILNQDVPNLGEEGDIVDVAPGYARNYLLPKKLVSLHTKQTVALFEAKKSSIERRKEAKRQAAAGEKEKLGSTVITLAMPAGEGGKLFGSVSSTNIVEELAKLGINIERKKIEVPGHVLKQLGDYKIHIKLYGNESAELKVSIVRGGDPKHRNEHPVEETKKVEPAAAADEAVSAE